VLVGAGGDDAEGGEEFFAEGAEVAADGVGAGFDPEDGLGARDEGEERGEGVGGSSLRTWLMRRSPMGSVDARRPGVADAARGGKVTLTVGGGVKDAWLNGVPVKAGAQITGEARIGANTLVLQVDEARVREGLVVRSGDVSFVSN
jgi:hypothetical protein